MGLDIAFNKQAALEAGLEVVVQQRCSDEEIAQEEKYWTDDDYLAWLKEQVTIINVPLPISMMFMQPIQVEATESGNDYIVRANTWGRVYKPLTKWLNEHSISWSAF